MKRPITFYIVTFLVIISCNSNKENIEETNQEMDSVLVDNSERITNALNSILMPQAKNDLNEFTPFRELDKFMIRYYNTSRIEALSSAQELVDLVKMVKDSLSIEKLNQPNVVSRINVLENEALRLADMAKITSIKDQEVEKEVTTIVEVYASLIGKINTIYRAETLQNTLDILDTEEPVKIDKNKKLREKFKTSITPRIEIDEN